MSESENLQDTKEEQKVSDSGEVDDISWDDVDEDLEKQKQLIKEQDAGKPKQQRVPELTELKSQGAETSIQNLDFVLDIPLEVTVELGRTSMAIYDLLQLGQGSIIELNKLAGEPLEIFVNHKLVAKGEVVVVNEKFGIRLTDIISPMERVENLG